MNFEAHLPENFSLLAQPSVYFVGIKGVGMASLAVLLTQAGVNVLGADTEESFVTDELLQEVGIVPEVFSEAFIPETVSCVVYSGAHKGSANPLVQEAVSRGLTVFSQAQALGLLSREKETLAVCGVGGKSTTSAVLASILDRAGWRPSFSVGVGNIPNLGSSGRWSGGQYFCVEADEYVADPLADLTPRFLYLSPTHIICTSLSYDHPDVYASEEDTRQAFLTFMRQRPEHGWLIYNGDNAALRAAASHLPRSISVGEHPENDVQLINFQVKNGIGSVELHATGKSVHALRLASTVPGRHNLRNMAYAAVLASELGVASEDILHGIAGFQSTPRRFTFIGTTRGGAQCFDDYAHHPQEILAIIETLKEWFPEKTPVIAFQPHTFSRTKALFSEFVAALSQAKGPVLILPIFASAREAVDSSVSSHQVVQALERAGRPTALIAGVSQLGETIEQFDARHIVITLGAGDIYKAYEHVHFV